MSKTTIDDRVAVALDALGVTGPVTSEARKEAVYDALVELWKEKKGPPTAAEIGAVCGLSRNIVDRAVHLLAEDERVVKLEAGVWLPVDL